MAKYKEGCMCWCCSHLAHCMKASKRIAECDHYKQSRISIKELLRRCGVGRRYYNDLPANRRYKWLVQYARKQGISVVCEKTGRQCWYYLNEDFAKHGKE